MRVGTFPEVVGPVRQGEDLLSFLQGRGAEIETHLLRSGGLLFRGFAAIDAAELERLGEGLFPDGLVEYKDRVTPRRSVRGRVYTSTDAPPDYRIVLHSENSFAAAWPLRLMFLCRHPADAGGATPIADTRRVYERVEPAVRKRFETKGVMYVRNFGVGPGMDYRTAFQVDGLAELEAYCRAADIEVERFGEDRVRTWQIRPATSVHPLTGEVIWFNHATVLHVTALDEPLRTVILRQYEPSDYPQNTLYGDGTPIPDEDLANVKQAYECETVRFDWQKGDLLLLDNMLTAHGRDAYGGDREVIAAMGRPTTWADVESSATASGVPSPIVGAAFPTRPEAGGDGDADEVLTSLLEAVRALLEIDAASSGDVYLDLDGDSLLATRIITRVREETGVELELGPFFDEITLAELATQRR